MRHRHAERGVLEACDVQAWVYLHLNRPRDTLAMIQQCQQFATLDPDVVHLQQWAQNFQAGVSQTVKTGGN